MNRFRWDNHNHQLTDLDVTDASSSATTKPNNIEELNKLNDEKVTKPESVSPFQAFSIGFGGPNTSSRPTARAGGMCYSIPLKKMFFHQVLLQGENY